MIRKIPVKNGLHLEEYAGLAYLAPAVHDLRMEARALVPRLAGRRVWMVNSTAQGGGVAEMMPRLVAVLRDLGVDCGWLVMAPGDNAPFFTLTKRIHNMIHGVGRPGFSPEEKQAYTAVSRSAAAALGKRIGPEDILVVHDPQPLGAGAEVKRRTGVRCIWRCHIGLDRQTPATDSAWQFLEEHARAYDHAVFSAAEYIPAFLSGRASVIHPAIDPLSHKNRDLSAHKLAGILCNAGLMKSDHPVLTPGWEHPALRLHPDGRFRPAHARGGAGLMFRPTVTQVSRWDRLKGWGPLLEGFLHLKRGLRRRKDVSERHRRRIRIARLVLAGPDPSAIQDDPEGREVLDSLRAAFTRLKPAEQESVVLLSLPMASRKRNELMVNVIQRCSTVVVQNSLQEGFGLTATEAMWKRIPLLGTSACGLRLQIRDRIDGLLTADPQDPREIAEKLDEMLADPVARDLFGRNAQRRVYDRFLVFTQAREWLRRLADASGKPPAATAA
jgi:trehalose synthase